MIVPRKRIMRDSILLRFKSVSVVIVPSDCNRVRVIGNRVVVPRTIYQALLHSDILVYEGNDDYAIVGPNLRVTVSGLADGFCGWGAEDVSGVNVIRRGGFLRVVLKGGWVYDVYGEPEALELLKILVQHDLCRGDDKVIACEVGDRRFEWKVNVLSWSCMKMSVVLMDGVDDVVNYLLSLGEVGPYVLGDLYSDLITYIESLRKNGAGQWKRGQEPLLESLS